ncbi:MAG: hypothetical protein AAF224_02780 [Pseudomonadota bacterium]
MSARRQGVIVGRSTGRRSLALAITFLASTVATAAVAQSLKSLRAQEREEAALADEGSYTSDVCGQSIATSIDWDSMEGWPEDESVADACGGALSALESLCRSGSAPAVESFVCLGDGSGPDYADSELRYGASPDGGDAYAATKSYLQGL